MHDRDGGGDEADGGREVLAWWQHQAEFPGTTASIADERSQGGYGKYIGFIPASYPQIISLSDPVEHFCSVWCSRDLLITVYSTCTGNVRDVMFVWINRCSLFLLIVLSLKRVVIPFYPHNCLSSSVAVIRYFRSYFSLIKERRLLYVYQFIYILISMVLC